MMNRASQHEEMRRAVLLQDETESWLQIIKDNNLLNLISYNRRGVKLPSIEPVPIIKLCRKPWKACDKG